ncbi:MAG: GntR family transcriptional regulator [Proteobacteria bacterium]|nr:GntR family transcriptional regulator [Pseudomonadota bacterium]MBU4275602.1 GntR family transcriptional regulator [Pseudomonadota bacterium]MBU4382879.1 GntR family transcriptional regulator [Pseudomonadota bacterium]MBU4604665.1 GntR family transcriptional regulator [Pseudomonadota bacterium]MCG2765394.1 GntR family transcriptional regulator [Desulfarculaceae bacterium]
MAKAPKKASPKNGNRRGLAIEEAYQKVKKMIYLNQFAPGQKIISNDLAKRLDISITPVIQALNRLEASNFVTYVPNKGYFVSEITEEDARQLYMAREALELYILPTVIENMTAKNFDEIKEAFSLQRSEAKNLVGRRLILLDAQFHLKIASFSGNDIICHMLQEIFEKLYLRYRPEYLGSNRIKEVAEEHRNLLEALRQRDVDKALAAIRHHIAQGMDRVVSSLQAEQQTDLSLD